MKKIVLLICLSIPLVSVAQDKPKLIVGIVVDQMRQEYLYRFNSKYSDGGFKRLMNDGFMMRNAHYNYVPTVTGPGHASVYTGTTPAYHGIISNEWYDKNLKLVNTTIRPIGKGIVIVTSHYTLINDSAFVSVIYTINGNGVIKVDYQLDVKPGLPNIPKIGMQMGIEKTYTGIEWYGRGPLENYIDRRYGFDVGIYQRSLNDFIESYVVPQENGNRTDVRWMRLENTTAKNGLLIVADSLLSMSAWPWTEENIQSARHTNKLKDAGYITLNIDMVQMGVGGNDSWSDVAAPLNQYQIPARPYKYSFYIYSCKKADKQTTTQLVEKTRF